MTINLHIPGDMKEIKHALQQVCHCRKGLIEAAFIGKISMISLKLQEEKIMVRD